MIFIKLPSGTIMQVEKIVRCSWDNFEFDTLNVWTVEDKECIILRNEDAKYLYQYLENIVTE